MVGLALKIVGRALRYAFTHWLRLFGYLSILSVIAVFAGWFALLSQAKRAGIDSPIGLAVESPLWPYLFPSLFVFWGVLFLIAATGALRAALAPEDRGPSFPGFSEPRGLSFVEPVRMFLAVAPGLVAVGLFFVYLGADIAAWWHKPLAALFAAIILAAMGMTLAYPAQVIAERGGWRHTRSRHRILAFVIAVIFALAVFVLLTAAFWAFVFMILLPLSDGTLFQIDQLSLPIAVLMLISLIFYFVLVLGFWAGLATSAYRADNNGEV